MKKQSGITLVEVVISFSIIVIISMMVVSVSGSYFSRFKVVREDITAKGFKNQGTLEGQTEKIMDRISFRNESASIILGLKAEKGLTSDMDEIAKLDKAITETTKKKNKADEFLKEYKDTENDWEREKTTIGDDFVLQSDKGDRIWQKKGKDKEDVYQVYAMDGTNMLMTAWIFGNTTVDKVPIIREIVRYVDMDTPTNREKQIEEYRDNKRLYVKIKYLKGFENKKDTPEQVTWYKTLPGYHIYPWTWEVAELVGNNFTPIFPDYYDFIYEKDTSGQDTTVPVSTKFDANKTTSIPLKGLAGHFVVCGIRTYSEQGILGNLSGSEPIYIWDLPLPKQNYLLQENISLINPHKLMDDHQLPEADKVPTKAFKVKSINPWNNENDKSTGKITAISGANLSSTDSSGANYMPDAVDKTGTVQGTDGRTFDSRARYLDFDKNSGYKVSLLPNHDQFSIFLSLGRGTEKADLEEEEKENKSGNVLCMSLTEKVKGLVVGEVDAKTFLMIRMDEAVIFRPKQKVRVGLKEQELEAKTYTATFENADDILQYQNKGMIITLQKDRGKFLLYLNGKSISFKDAEHVQFDTSQTEIYLGNVTEVEDIKKLISAEELHKDKLNSYQSAKMHLYEISAIKEVGEDKIDKVNEAMMKRYGIEKLK